MLGIWNCQRGSSSTSHSVKEVAGVHQHAGTFDRSLRLFLSGRMGLWHGTVLQTDMYQHEEFAFEKTYPSHIYTFSDKGEVMCSELRDICISAAQTYWRIWRA